MDKSAGSPIPQKLAGTESAPELDVVLAGTDGNSESEDHKRKREEPETEQLHVVEESTTNEASEDGAAVEKHEVEEDAGAVDAKRQRIDEASESSDVENIKIEVEPEVGNGHTIEAFDAEQTKTEVESEVGNGPTIEASDAEQTKTEVESEVGNGQTIEASDAEQTKTEIESEVGNGQTIEASVSGADQTNTEVESGVGNGHEINEETASQETIQQIAPSVSLDVPLQTLDGQPTSRRIEVPNSKVGVLIGKAGETIKFLQFNTGAKIQIMRDAEADPNAPSRPVELIGTPESINKAEKLIKDVIAEADAGGSPALVARGFGSAQFGAEQLQIQIPNEKVGLIIGKGGETIKDLQTRSRARIQLIPQHPPEGDTSKERTVRITGNKEQIESAIDLIKQVMNQAPLRSPAQGGYLQQTQPRHRAPTLAQWAPRATPPPQPMSGYNYPPRGPYHQTQTATHYAAYSRPSISHGPSWDQRSSAPIHLRQAPPASAPVSGGYYSQPPAQQIVYGQPPLMSHYQQSYSKPAYVSAPMVPVQTAPPQPQHQPQQQQQPYPYGAAAYQHYAAATADVYGQYQAAPPVYGTPGVAYGQYPSTGYGEQPAQDSSAYGYTGSTMAPSAAAAEVPYGSNLYGMQPPPTGPNLTGYEQNVAAVPPVSGNTPAGYVQQYAHP